tara:strand:- start:5895 stop:7769 length:1875 start_codon:yes stop_codon:yes gene_type:complete
LEKNKIVCLDWIGRFGNRCHSYLYGRHIENKFGNKFYIPSEWEGSFLFKNPAPIADEELVKRAYVYAGGSRNSDGFLKNKEKVDSYNKQFNDNIEFIDPFFKNSYGKKNSAYISLVSDAQWCFENIRLSEIRECFEFTDEVKNTDLYKYLQDEQGTYDVAHFRRTDISRPHYKGGHSMVSKKSYIDAFKKYDVDESKVVWVSDEQSIGWKYPHKIPTIGGKQISWLPDFLKLIFSRNLFRSNSSFSLWAGWLGDCNVYAPWLHEYSPGKEVDFKFVEGNHPHWMSVKGVHVADSFPIINDIKKEVKMKKEKDKIMMVHWNGRFGNRFFSYMFGRSYADKFNLDFYLPSEWEGTHLFRDTGYKIIEDDDLRLKVNQTDRVFDNLAYRKKAIDEYNAKTNSDLKYFSPDNLNDYGKTNVFFDSLCVHSSHIFESYDKSKILKWFEFSDQVKNLDVYKRLEDKQGTYDIAHLRRDDISNARYNAQNQQAYSVVSKNSYLTAFKKFGFDEKNMEWTTDDWTGKWGVGKPTIRGGWQYPAGSKVIPEVIFDWLPDFLRLYFARNIFRGNSSFSWVAGFLSPTAQVYSPILHTRKIFRSEQDETEFEFVKGNHPHWLNLKGFGCDEININ